jgi:ribonucleoside-diphosphate reductase alpha chain
VIIKDHLPKIDKDLKHNKRSSLASQKTVEFNKGKISKNALAILQNRYLLQNTKGQIIESPMQLFRRVAHAIVSVESKYHNDPTQIEEEFFQILSNLEFLPNTPTLMNAGTRLGQLSACFVLPVEDSLEGIFEALKWTAIIHQSGGGTGFDFSNLRPQGEPATSIGVAASGPIKFMTIFDKTTDVIKQGRMRRGANMGILRIDHPDILEFITSKSQKNFLNNFNISVAVTDQFMDAVSKNKEFFLINPRNKKVVKKLDANKVFNLITEQAWKTGDPGLIFLDQINRENPTPAVGKITATNPCSEQPLLPWESCNLGSINLSKIISNKKIDWQKLQKLVHLGVRFLDDVIDANNYPNNKISKMTHSNRKIGLGVMGFADALIKMGIPYNSKKALDLAAKIMQFIQNEAHGASRQLGKERGNFPNFKKSIWCTQKKYKHMRNASVTTIAPTGTISIIAGCSSGIEPLFAISFIRNVMDGTKLLEVNPIFLELLQKRIPQKLFSKIAESGSIQKFKELPKDIRKIFVTALDIDPYWHVKMQAAFQKYTDSGVSKTINLPPNSNPRQVREAFLLAHRLGCKGITVYRYGSKPNQTLRIGKISGFKGDQIIADSEFAGGCDAVTCPH